MVRLFFFLFLSQFLFAQVFWLASGEAGYYNSSGNFLQSEKDFLTRLNLNGGYKYKSDEHYGNIDFQFLPEIYGFANKLRITKIQLDAIYSHLAKEFDWSMNILANQYFFTGDLINFSYDSFILNAQIIFPVKPQISINTKFGFAYRNFNQRDAASLDIFFSEIDFIYSYSSFLKLGSGLYLEKFDLKNKYDSFFSMENKNSGSRIGPAVNLNYARSFILSLDYRFLLHDSEITIYPSYDQWLRVIAGKTIIKNLTAFMLIDYYYRNLKYNSGNDVTELLYSPVNVENRFYFKLSNEVKLNQKVYLKIGYYDENLFYRDFSLTGWKGLIGFEIKG